MKKKKEKHPYVAYFPTHIQQKQQQQMNIIMMNQKQSNEQMKSKRKKKKMLKFSCEKRNIKKRTEKFINT